jgi:hypothetical protein
MHVDDASGQGRREGARRPCLVGDAVPLVRARGSEEPRLCARDRLLVLGCEGRSSGPDRPEQGGASSLELLEPSPVVGSKRDHDEQGQGGQGEADDDDLPRREHGSRRPDARATHARLDPRGQLGRHLPGDEERPHGIIREGARGPAASSGRCAR